MKTYYIHLRYYENDQPSNRGGVTIAYRVVDDTYHIGIARCSMRDNYSKRLGRAIATGRILSGDYYTKTAEFGTPAFDTVVEAVHKLLDTHFKH